MLLDLGVDDADHITCLSKAQNMETVCFVGPGGRSFMGSQPGTSSAAERHFVSRPGFEQIRATIAGVLSTARGLEAAAARGSGGYSALPQKDRSSNMP